MASLSNTLFRVYQRTIHSLAFYPTLIALGFLLLCIFTMAIEYQPWLMHIKQSFDIGLVRNADNARLILGTLVGGILSLMVFSFSMVMVVLNNAAAALSPRVIPGLVSSKSHQKTLGVYLGTILYSLLLITTIELNGSDKVPSLGVLISLGFGIGCLGLFVHFIRSISQSIQVEHILSNLYTTTHRKLADQIAKNNALAVTPQWPNDQHWPQTRAKRNGYFKTLNISAVNEVLHANDLQMTVLVHHGFFVTAGHPLFKLSRPMDDDICQQLLDCFDFFIEEYASVHYFFGCKQISEIAVKALSPGINDPGTAIKAVDLLSVLFSLRLQLPHFNAVKCAEQAPRLFILELTVEQLLQLILGSIRTYGASDPSVLNSLLQALKNMLYATAQSTYHGELKRFVQSVLESADAHLQNPRDREEINAYLNRFNAAMDPAESPLKPLQIDSR